LKLELCEVVTAVAVMLGIWKEGNVPGGDFCVRWALHWASLASWKVSMRVLPSGLLDSSPAAL